MCGQTLVFGRQWPTMHTQLQSPLLRCNTLQSTAVTCTFSAQSQSSNVLRGLQQHRLSCRSLDAVPARFADASHVAYYEPTVAGSKTGKVNSRIKQQWKRLNELKKETIEQGGQPSPTQWSQLVQELQEMSGNLSDVAKVSSNAV